MLWMRKEKSLHDIVYPKRKRVLDGVKRALMRSYKYEEEVLIIVVIVVLWLMLA